jgi:hypothetical protein
MTGMDKEIGLHCGALGVQAQPGMALLVGADPVIGDVTTAGGHGGRTIREE